MWAGTGSLYTEFECCATPVHTISLLAFSELVEIKRNYVALGSPDAIDHGPYSTHFHTAASGADVLFASFECEPYIDCGKQRRHLDPRSDQVAFTTDAMLAVAPHLSLGEQAREFFHDDHIHGKWTQARSAMADSMHPYPIVTVYDTAVGGTLCRPRSWACWERLTEYSVLQPWCPDLQRAPATRPWSLLQTPPSLSSLWIPGHLVLRIQPGTTASADTPSVVGEVFFPPSSLAP